MTHPAHILAIDPGRTSGVALFRDGQLVDCAEVDVRSRDVEQWVTAALLPALEANRTLVMVGETWGRGGPLGMQQWQSLGAAWHRWEWALFDLWKVQRKIQRSPAPKWMRVHVNTWRSKVFGGRVGGEMAKRLSMETARQRLGAELEDNEHNAAEAVMIGHWATHAPEVLAKVPKRFRKETP